MGNSLRHSSFQSSPVQSSSVQSPNEGRTTFSADQLRQTCENSFSSFCYLLQEEGWMDPVHEQLCNWIQYHLDSAFPPGTDLSDPELTETVKLAIIMPRGSLKTTFANRNLSAWLPVHFGPEIRSLMVTNTHPNAKKKMEAIKSIFTHHEQFQAVFPELQPDSKDKWNSDIAILPRKGTYEDGTFESAGVGTKKTGSHYNVIIEDDTLAPDSDEMNEDLTLPSHESMERAIGYHKAAHPLLVPKGVRVRIVVSTRWGEGDLIDYLKKSDNGWKFFDMPALNSQGKPIFSKFYSQSALEEIKKDIGQFMFSCLYLNEPMDPRAKTFKPDQIRRATHELPSITEMDYLTLAVDPAISQSRVACDTSIVLCGHRKEGPWANLYVYDAFGGKYSMGETIEKSIEVIRKAGPEMFRSYRIENVAYQQALLERFTDILRQEGLPQRVVPFSSRTNKIDRIRNTLEPLFYSNRIHLSPDLPRTLFDQLDNFPNGKLVDFIDALSFHTKDMNHSEKKEIPVSPQEEIHPHSIEAAMENIRSRKKDNTGVLKRSTHGTNQRSSFPGALKQSRYNRVETLVTANF